MQMIVSDESINRHGYRVLTAGINLDSFLINPVMLYVHLRSESGTGKPILPIGRWENISKQGSKLIATPVFDMGDEFARSIASKVDKGMLNAASIHLDPIEWSEEPALMLPGQELPTVTKCELIEISVCDIPVNKNAVRLSIKSMSNDYRLGVSAGATAYEQLWRAGRLEHLKLTNPKKFSLLQAEHLYLKGNKNAPIVDTAAPMNLSTLQIFTGADEYNRLLRLEKLASLKAKSPEVFDYLARCFKEDYKLRKAHR